MTEAIELPLSNERASERRCGGVCFGNLSANTTSTARALFLFVRA